MLLDEILTKFQLNKTTTPRASSVSNGTKCSGMATLDQLDFQVQEKYANFIGYRQFVSSLPPRPSYIKTWTEPSTTLPFGSDKHARRIRLTSGDDSDYEANTSAADFALICDLLQEGFDPGDVEIIMRTTRYRPKLDEMRGSATYLTYTISNALEALAQGNGPISAVVPTLPLDKGRVSIPTSPPAQRDYVWQGRMVAGHAYAMGGFGGVSKSQAALQFAASISMGMPFGNIATKKGSTLLIFGEDDISEITRRLGAYASHEQLSPAQRTEVEKNIRTFGLIGEDTRLTATRNGVLEATEFSEPIIAAAAELARVSGEATRLIVLDHAGLAHGGDFNAREDVSLTMRIVNHIAHETGAAVLLLAHSPKSSTVSETSEASAIAGSTAFVDQTRGALILATMRPSEAKTLGIPEATRHEYVSLSVVKNNYGKTGDVSWFLRNSPPGWEVGVLVPIDLQSPLKGACPKTGVADRVKQFIATHPGQYAKSAIRDRHSGKTGVLKASKNEVAAAIEEMLAAGVLIVREPTPEERSKFGLPQQTKSILDIPSPANGAIATVDANHAARS